MRDLTHNEQQLLIEVISNAENIQFLIDELRQQQRFHDQKLHTINKLLDIFDPIPEEEEPEPEEEEPEPQHKQPFYRKWPEIKTFKLPDDTDIRNFTSYYIAVVTRGFLKNPLYPGILYPWT